MDMAALASAILENRKELPKPRPADPPKTPEPAKDGQR